MNGAALALGVAGALAVASRLRGSPNLADRLPYKQKTANHSLYGVIFGDPIRAFDEIAIPFLDNDYWYFVGVEDDEEREDNARILVLDSWAQVGVLPSDPVFAWHSLHLQPNVRGRGLGRRTVTRIEDLLRRAGVRAIVLQAGSLDEVHGRPSLPFWTKLGYKEWTGEYGHYEDRILWKVL